MCVLLWRLLFIVTTAPVISLMCMYVACLCTESTGRYLLIAVLLSTLTMLSQTAFQLYGIFAEPTNNSTLAPCESLAYSDSIHRVPKSAAPLLQTCLIQFVVYGFQQNIVHCTILTLVTLIPIMMYTTYYVCLV